MRASQPALPLALALSGGADSTALLVAAAEAWPGRVHAIHVHHGLQAAADAFERHCQALCRRWAVLLHVCRVDARHGQGESPEDAARRARYVALADTALQQRIGCVWLAQQADDQVETLVLALSRGAGLPGLAAMPARFERHGVVFERPLLALAGAQLRQGLREEGIDWVEDPTNLDTAFTRNRIRAEVLPALERAFPAMRQTFARSARHAAQAQELLTELAQADLMMIGQPPQIDALRRLSRARQANLLRHWLWIVGGAPGSTVQLEELLDQIAACRTRGHRIHIKVGRGYVQRDGHQLVFSPSV